MMSFPDTGALQEQIGRRIAELAAAPAEQIVVGTGSAPYDFGDLIELVDELYQRGGFDALARLGKQLAQVAARQLDRSHDDGDVADVVFPSLEIVAQAVQRRDVPAVEKLLYAIDLQLEPGGQIGQTFQAILEISWSTADWAAVAEQLQRRLAMRPDVEPSEAGRSQRLGLVRLLIGALDSAGRPLDATAVCRREAEATGDYLFLVDRLLAAGSVDEAERQAIAGIDGQYGEWNALAMRQRLRQIAVERQNWRLVAAHDAEHFFVDPDLRSLRALLDAAAQAECLPAVRQAAERYLQTGELPVAVRAGVDIRGKAAGAASARWPLPDLPYHAPLHILSRWQFSGGAGGPAQRYRAGLELALAERSALDARQWYERLREVGGIDALTWFDGCQLRERVASALAADDPTLARAIRDELAARRAHPPQARLEYDPS